MLKTVTLVGTSLLLTVAQAPNQESQIAAQGDTAVTQSNGNGAGAERLDLDAIMSEANANVCDVDFSDASGSLVIQENPQQGTTRLTFHISHAVPDMIYSVWLRSTSPLTGKPATPAAPTTALDDLAIISPPEIGGTSAANAFYTGPSGNGTVTFNLDFLLSDGVYPFAEGDSTINSSPFTFRVISHCTDGLVHGLIPGPHEPNFQISL